MNDRYHHGNLRVALIEAATAADYPAEIAVVVWLLVGVPEYTMPHPARSTGPPPSW